MAERSKLILLAADGATDKKICAELSFVRVTVALWRGRYIDDGISGIEAACMLALQIGACQYRHVRDILTNNRDQSVPATAGEWVSPDHVHVRGPGYYQ